MSYAIVKKEFFHETRLPIGPGKIVQSGLPNEAMAIAALEGVFDANQCLYPDKHCTMPGFWVTNVLFSKAQGDRAWLSFSIIEIE